MVHLAVWLTVLPALLAAPAGLRATALDQASWQALPGSGERGAEIATAVVSETLSQTLLRLPKSAVLPSGRHEADATLVLLDGELTLEAEGKTFALTKGSVLEVPKGTVYRGRTKWDKPALVLITLAGPWSRPAE